MKTVETEKEGLKRGYTLTVPAKDIEARMDSEIKKLAPQVKMPGFRPGKVPPNLIKKMHGEQLHAEALRSVISESIETLLTDEKIRPAVQPEVELSETYEQGKDAEVNVKLEALPDVPTPSIDGLALDRMTLEADEKVLDEQIKKLAESQKSWKDAPKTKKAAMGDLVVMDFEGKVDGETFEGGKGEDMSVELGSGQLIPGFEDGLVGIKAGESRDVDVTFPEDYPAENLKGKPAVFAVTAKQVKVEGETKIDDEFAKSLGLEDLEQLRGVMKDQVQQELNGLTRTHMKRQLLDQLAEGHDFAVPQTMVDAEHQNIMNQLRHEASHEADPDAALKEIEAEEDDYRKIAERRVRLGLLLSEVGAAHDVEVSQQEMNMLVSQAAAQYPPQDRDKFIEYVQNEPMAAAQLRAPLYEDKVVDFLFTKADVTDVEATREQVEAELESEEGHKPVAKGKKKPAAKKAPAKKAPAKKPAAKKAAAKKPATKKAPAKKAAAKKPAAKKAPAKKAAPKKKPAAKKK